MSRQYNNFKKFLDTHHFTIVTTLDQFEEAIVNEVKRSNKRYVTFQYSCPNNHLSSITNTSFVNKISALKKGKIEGLCAMCLQHKKYYQHAQTLGYQITAIKNTIDGYTIKFICKCGHSSSTDNRNFKIKLRIAVVVFVVTIKIAFNSIKLLKPLNRPDWNFYIQSNIELIKTNFKLATYHAD